MPADPKNSSATASSTLAADRSPSLERTRADLSESRTEPVHEFVRTPFRVRKRVVSVWRPLPEGLWETLNTESDRRVARRREIQAVVAVVAIALVLSAAGTSIGRYAAFDGAVERATLVGASVADGGPPGAAGSWYVTAFETWHVMMWTVLPSLMGWAVLRSGVIPVCARASGIERSAAAMAGHLASVYLFVYLMIAVGALVLALLLALWPAASQSPRWWLWCFLFGESFFVPGVMWSRLMAQTGAERVFGRWRYMLLAAWLALFVVVPIVGMSVALARMPD